MYGKTFLKISAALVALMLSQNTLAENYWGIGGGTTNWDIKPLFGLAEVENGSTLDLLWGSRNGNTGIEAEFTFSSHDWVGISDATHNATNIIVAGIGFLPVNQGIDLYGKIGIDIWSTSVDLADVNFDGDDGVALVVGAGANLNLSENFSLRVEHKIMGGIGDGVDEGDIGQTTIMAVFNY